MAKGFMVCVVPVSSGNYMVEFSTVEEFISGETYSEDDLFRTANFFDIEVFITGEWNVQLHYKSFW